ncbi:MAG: hypothetical protein ACR2RA_20280, partial [Geminicoccaceae bacterium]
AAADGDAGALLRLATRYETGDAVPVDLDHAAALLEQAAMRGDVTAQYRLALMQAGSLDREEHFAEAYGWLLLAERTSPDRPEGLLGDALGEAISSRLDEAEIDTAEAWAAAFTPMSGPVDLPSLLGEVDPRVELAKLEQDLAEVGCGAPARPADPARMLVYAAAGAVDGLDEFRGGLADHGVALDVVALSPPLCDLRSLLTKQPERPIEAGVALADVDPGGEARYREGDRVVLEIEAAAQDRHLAVDYVVHTGDVLHLHPRDGDDGRLPANQPLRLGDGSDGRQPWQVGPPFGRDLLIVTISDQPLPAAWLDRPMVEPVGPYLAGWEKRTAAFDANNRWDVVEQVILTEAR